MSLAVVGTDTDVGKTVISALVAARHANLGRVAYWKPVATGRPPGAAASDDSRSVGAWVGSRVTILPETYGFEDPVSPHLAARREGDTVRRSMLDRDLASHRAAGWRLIVEGIGGVLVPFDDDGVLFADWLATTRLPALVVARAGLGTINHSLLTLEALRHRRVPIVGMVMNGPPDIDNQEAVARFGEIAPVLEVAPIEPLDASTLEARAAAFDPDGRLASYLDVPDPAETP